jgi:hypothetical protein
LNELKLYECTNLRTVNGLAASTNLSKLHLGSCEFAKV